MGVMATNIHAIDVTRCPFFTAHQRTTPRPLVTGYHAFIFKSKFSFRLKRKALHRLN